MKKREVVRVNIVIDKENKDFADKELYNLSAFLNKALSTYRKKVQKGCKEKDDATSHNIYSVNNYEEEEEEEEIDYELQKTISKRNWL